MPYSLCVASIRAGNFHKLEQIGIGCVSRPHWSPVERMKPPSAAQSSIRRLAFSSTCFWHSAQHKLEGVDVSLHTDLIALAFLDIGNVYIAARWFFDWFHHVDICLLTNHFDHFSRSTANMQVRENSISLADLRRFLDER
jgi:hypothetical protein